MIPRFFTKLSFLIGFCLLFGHLDAQISEGGIPFSLQKDNKEVLTHTIPTKTVGGLDLGKVKREDRQNTDYNRFAAPFPITINPGDEGRWTTLPDGRQLWQLTLKVRGALGIFVVFDDFKLPKGSQLFGFDAHQKTVYGAYTDRNNKPHGDFMLGMVKGDAVTLEYLQPAGATSKQPFFISKLYLAYEPDLIQPSDYPFQTYDGFGDAMGCHVNINCPQGNNWQDHKRGVVRMLRVFEEGVGWCTGTLVNNTNMDGTPYVLSAYHCIAGATPILNLWIFNFNYELPDCPNGMVEPTLYTMQGCLYRSGREESDFMLLELEDVIPQAYNVYFAGWNRDGSHVPADMTGIHHPRGDVKKISTSNQPVIVFNNSIIWSNSVTTPPNHHFRVLLSEGTIEDGSSGSALFNENGLITGQLHGGNASCSGENTGYYGRFSVSWDAGSTPSTRLSDWLDPANTGQLTLGHYEYPAVALSGKVGFPNGTGIQNVKLKIIGSAGVDSVFTDANGQYTFTNLRQNDAVTLTASRDGGAKNGVSILDMIMIRSDLLQQMPLDAHQSIAADVNKNGAVSILDMILIRQILLQQATDFATGNWIFPSNDFLLPMNGTTTQDVLIYKTGDVNFTADPGL